MVALSPPLRAETRLAGDDSIVLSHRRLAGISPGNGGLRRQGDEAPEFGYLRRPSLDFANGLSAF
jgi:hypothetical protein